MIRSGLGRSSIYRSAGYYGLGSSTETPPLTYATHYNRYPSGTYTTAGTQLKGFSRYQVFIGSGDRASLAAVFHNKYLQTAGSPLSPGNAVTIESVALESANVHMSNQSVPMTFSGGRSIVLANGDVNIKTDEVLPAAFGVSSFVQGDLFYIKIMWSVASAGHKIPVARRYNENNNLLMNGTVTFRSWTYDPAVTTPSSIDSVNVWTSTPTVTGTAATPITSQVGPCPIIIGRLVSPSGKKVYTLTGDSLVDNMTSFLRWGCINSTQGVQANCEASVSGGHQSDLTTLGSEFFGYANVLLDEMGINNSTDFTSFLTYWATARASGIQKIVRTKLTPSTTVASNTATAVTYVGSGGITDVTVVTGGTLPAVGTYVAVQGATPSQINGNSWSFPPQSQSRKLVLTSGAGQFTYQLTTNIGSGTATGTITWSTAWSIEADQTYSDGGAAGNQGTFNNQVDTWLGNATVDYVLPMNSVKGVDPYKWGASNLGFPSDSWANSTTVGRHCLNSGYAEVVTVIDAVTVA